MKFKLLSIAAIVSLALVGCETVTGLQKDIGSLGSAVGTKVNQIAETTNEALTSKSKKTDPVESICPDISVDGQLDSMTEFHDLKKTDDALMVSTVRLTSTKSECIVDGEFLTMQISLNFDGQLGPKARRKDGDRPFFAYPYFVAVYDGADNKLAEEMFAASVTYDETQEDIQLIETIRQKLPLNNNGSVPSYKIEIGFQLSEDQLFYNASQ